MKIVSNYDLSKYDFLSGTDVQSVNTFISSAEMESDWILFILNAEQWACIIDTDNFYCAKNKICVFTQSKIGMSDDLMKAVNFDFTLAEDFDANTLQVCVNNAKKQHDAAEHLSIVQRDLNLESEKLNDLNEIGEALSSISDPYVLMNL
ncbi:hypothetical protein MJH12_06710, partial [bacterium]|nr:hypothetical protein [bacterium]